MRSTAIFGAFALFLNTVHGHISMASPIPYGKPDTSPLNPSGSNFPCKTDNGFGFSSSTSMKVGESQTISFAGTAVHNGGSCQLSLTKGYKPTASSDFKVIMSIEGGCPGLNGQTTTYDYKIPEEVPNGNYSFGWTWYNNIGNREIYMNCAPISVTGSSQKDDTAYNALPDIAVFNIPSISPCGTKETFDVQFPNPGKYVITGSQFKPSDPTNCNVKSTSSGSGSSSGGGSSSGIGSGSYPSSGASSGGSSVGASFPSSTATLGGSSKPSSAAASSINPAAATSIKSVVSSATAKPAIYSPQASSAAASSVAPAASAASGGISACNAHGAMVCSNDGSMYALCNFGKAVWQPVAAGTKCAGGQIGFAKRSAKFRKD